MPRSSVNKFARVTPFTPCCSTASVSACSKSIAAAHADTPNPSTLSLPVNLTKFASILFDFVSSNGRKVRTTVSPFMVLPASAMASWS